MSTRRFLPRTILLLGAVSLLNDAASEMLAPLLPVFLTAVLGAGPVVVGLVEGLAEAAASLLKLVSGWLADRGWNRKGLVFGGYLISNTARPLIGTAPVWGWVVALRFLDRVGKGLRTAPRDALIAGAVEQARRGRAFGFHRAMDHAGAMLGPLIAFALLQSGVDMRSVFLLSAVPGLLVVLLLGLGLPPTPPGPTQARPPLRWGALDPQLRVLILASGGLALAAAPEVFLVLWAQGHGLAVVWVPLVWAAAHGVKTLVALPTGGLSDRFGRLPVVLAGWCARVVVLVLLATASDGPLLIWSLFLAYSAALAASEGAERAMIGDFAPADQKATAYGLYHMLSGGLALPGALLFGGLWEGFGMAAAFLTSAALTMVFAAILFRLCRKKRPG